MSEDPIPLAALQHWRYCPRQCALIHVEQAFAENVYTLRGQAVHARVDEPGVEVRAGLRVERALPVWSERHPLIGRLVEHDLRELVISRGRTGYVAFYDYVEAIDTVLILALRSQSEVGYADDIGPT